MSLTSYRAAPPRVRVSDRHVGEFVTDEHTVLSLFRRLVDLAATYSPTS